MKEIIDGIKGVLGIDLPPAAVIVITYMVLDGRASMDIIELANNTCLHRAEMDHVGIILRTKRMGTYKSSNLTLTHPPLLALMEKIKAANVAADDVATKRSPRATKPESNLPH